MSKWTDDLDTPHHLSKRQILRVILICLVALAVLLAGGIYAHAQPAPRMVTSDGCNTCVMDAQTGLSTCTAVWCGPAPVLATPARQSAPMALKAAIGSYVAFSVIDAGQTASCLIAGTCYERNPLLRPFAGSPNGLVAVKLAANSATAYGIWRMRKKHPKAALGLAIAAAGFQAVIVAKNVRVARGQR